MTDYILPELLVLVPVLYLVGEGIKRTALDNKFIPFILGLFGVCLAIAYVLAATEIGSFGDVCSAVFSGVTQGILCAGAAVYGNQLYKQSKK